MLGNAHEDVQEGEKKSVCFGCCYVLRYFLLLQQPCYVDDKDNDYYTLLLVPSNYFFTFHFLSPCFSLYFKYFSNWC